MQYRQRGRQHQRVVAGHTCAMLAIISNLLTVSLNRISPRHAQVMVVVWASARSTIKSADVIEHRAPIHHSRTNANVVAAQQREVVISLDMRRRRQPGFPVAAKQCSVLCDASGIPEHKGAL